MAWKILLLLSTSVAVKVPLTVLIRLSSTTTPVVVPAITAASLLPVMVMVIGWSTELPIVPLLSVALMV